MSYPSSSAIALLVGALLAALASGCSDSADSAGGDPQTDTGGDAGLDAMDHDGAATDAAGDTSGDEPRPDLGDAAEVGDVPTTPQESTFRLVHAAVGGPEAIVTLDGDEVAHLRYGESTPVLEVAHGTHTVSVQAVSDSGPPAVLWQSEVTVPGGTAVTVLLARDDGSERGIRALFLSGEVETPPTGQASVRFVHALAEPVELTVDLWDDGMGDARLERSLTAAPTAVRVPAGEPLVARLRRDGEPLLRFTVGPFESGEVATLLVTGRVTPTLRPEDRLALLPLGPVSVGAALRPDPWLAVLHASPDAPALDLFEGGEERLDDLAFGELASGVQVAPATHELAVFPTDWELSTSYPPDTDDEPWAAGLGATLERGERYLVVVSGLVGATDESDALTLLTLREGFDVSSGEALGRLLNAVPGGAELDVDASGLPGWADLLESGSLAQGQSTPETGLPLPVGDVVVALGVEDEYDGSAQLFELTVGARDRLLLVATSAAGSRGALVPEPLVVLAVDVAPGDWGVGEVSPPAVE